MADEENEVTKQLSEMQAEIERLRNHNETLLGEKKAEAKKRADAEANAKAESEAKLLASKDFEQLHKSSELEREKLSNRLKELQDNIANEKKGAAALKVAAELADGSNAELLSTFISKRLKYTDDGLKVTDQNGDLTVSSLDDLKREFQNDAKFAALLRGSQASGGGAKGGEKSNGVAKEISRGEFEALPPNKRSEFAKLVKEGKASII